MVRFHLLLIGHFWVLICLVPRFMDYQVCGRVSAPAEEPSIEISGTQFNLDRYQDVRMGEVAAADIPSFSPISNIGVLPMLSP